MIDFDSEDEESVIDLVAKLRGKYDTQDLGQDIEVFAFILTGIAVSVADLMKQEAEAEERGDPTWLDKEPERSGHLFAAANYLRGTAVAMRLAVGDKEEQHDEADG